MRVGVSLEINERPFMTDDFKIAGVAGVDNPGGDPLLNGLLSDVKKLDQGAVEAALLIEIPDFRPGENG
jgi:hypothetical protein